MTWRKKSEPPPEPRFARRPERLATFLEANPHLTLANRNPEYGRPARADVKECWRHLVNPKHIHVGRPLSYDPHSAKGTCDYGIFGSHPGVGLHGPNIGGSWWELDHTEILVEAETRQRVWVTMPYIPEGQFDDLLLVGPEDGRWSMAMELGLGVKTLGAARSWYSDSCPAYAIARSDVAERITDDYPIPQEASS